MAGNCEETVMEMAESGHEGIEEVKGKVAPGGIASVNGSCEKGM